MVSKTVIDGKYTSAVVYLPEEEIEEVCYDQIENIVNHEAFTNPVRIMPDAHWGAGCVIGFSMPLSEKIIPNVVGVDISCGMLGINLGDVSIEDHKELDREIRDSIPMGFNVNDENNIVHVKNEYDWEGANKTLKEFNEQFTGNIDFSGYDNEFFKDLCDRVDYNQNRAIKSVGSLGRGNHFIELAKDESNDLWVVVHSGSRGLGYAIAEYWQEKAVEYRKRDLIEEFEQSFKDFVDDKYTDYVENDMSFNKEKIREDFEKEEIEKAFGKLGTAKSEYQDKIKGQLEYDEDLAYLEGEESHGYYIDMIFASYYASLSREIMAKRVVDILDAEPIEKIESVHNYIDFEDMTIRKGACPAREDQKIIIPFNMRDGSVIAKGKGNKEWNKTAPHGAGRSMSPTQAEKELSLSEFKDMMNDVEGKFTENMLGESPKSYKEKKLIQEQINPTAEVVNTLEVIHNIKANKN